MSRELDITGSLAIGNGEPCPFCLQEDDRLTDDVFVSDTDNDIMEHMMNEHPSELSNALFKEPPPKPWLEQRFQLLLAKIYAKLRAINEDERVNQETFEEFMQNIYADVKEHFENESN
tara:strand:+ start:205 stop:558 length:354 start_codon:yes stop_codon:yes gene_type:complete